MPFSKNKTNLKYVRFHNKDFYVIEHIDCMPSFLISLISSDDHWSFITSNGGITAGRTSATNSFFPYITEDKINDSIHHTGKKTIIRVHNKYIWEPFQPNKLNSSNIVRNLYKSIYGDHICFEECNNDLQIVFRYHIRTSIDYGFVFDSEIINKANNVVNIELLDGLQNILPAKIDITMQGRASNLVDAYKWSELNKNTKLALYTTYSGITDHPQPLQSLNANCVYYLGDKNVGVSIDPKCVSNFYADGEFNEYFCLRGRRGAYFIKNSFNIAPMSEKKWRMVADVAKNQTELVALNHELQHNKNFIEDITNSVEKSEIKLQSIIAKVDGLELVQNNNVSNYHFANVLFNSMRGGVFCDQYFIDIDDFISSIKEKNINLYTQYKKMLSQLPTVLSYDNLQSIINDTADNNLQRLFYEYIPIIFSRRHGDPSRPWNKFSIKLKDINGNSINYYEGNWRDIFQNWEALLYSYPKFITNVITKFVNNSTADGYNPYRIKKNTIEWEVEDKNDDWSYIGYWGDHQIIYLLKFLEMSCKFDPETLTKLLRKRIFSYVNVPYQIKPFYSLLANARDTIDFNDELDSIINNKVKAIGTDAKMLLDSKDNLILVNLLEKILVPMLSKLSNLVIGGGIWLNTQRPEWNDANNAIVGKGLSMVTLYYLRRYLIFLMKLLANETNDFAMSKNISIWMLNVAKAMNHAVMTIKNNDINEQSLYKNLELLALPASRYRDLLYKNGVGNSVMQSIGVVKQLLADATVVIDYSIATNKTKDGFYHSYNLLSINNKRINIKNLYLMLEGQVAAISSYAIKSDQVVKLLKSLYNTPLYRKRQNSFILYPDKKLPTFLEKNCIDKSRIISITGLIDIINNSNNYLFIIDKNGNYRFNADLIDTQTLSSRIAYIANNYDSNIKNISDDIVTLYKEVFEYDKFTGRSSGMFGYEGLGCIYWHMVSKLLVATQEMYFKALNENDEEHKNLRIMYYKLREGLSFNKTPELYGAFPTDPYSHSAVHYGAKQPGMTGQVKEWVLMRLGELGVTIYDAKINFKPSLLKISEFLVKAKKFRYFSISGEWVTINLEQGTLAFTYCQTPIIYKVVDSDSYINITFADASTTRINSLELNTEISRDIFSRNANVTSLVVHINKHKLFE